MSKDGSSIEKLRAHVAANGAADERTPIEQATDHAVETEYRDLTVRYADTLLIPRPAPVPSTLTLVPSNNKEA